ncbi:receptor-type tyrosine-protein phosphatase H-like isoform X2 [Hemitrygon akajei]|uniref:receptor-type tyrosine-protein phosphatase H-like isoform X2 n=1 Tax=Hemitrygon akajei TaxID=2704970 RepID=UPI003BF9BC42
MKGKILNRMRWSWMERGMRPFNCWLLLLSLLSTWEGVCSQNCSAIQVSPVNTTALKVDWSSIIEDLSDISISLINITIGQDTRSINSSKKEEIIDKLEPGTNYNIFINAENGSFNCNLSSTTNPSPVTGLKAVDGTTNSLTIEWIQPADTRAVNYTYRITVTNVINSSRSIHNTKKGQTNFTATGLDPGDRYTLSVESVTPENTLSTPEELTNTTNPSPVTGLKAVDRTTNSLTIEWIQPTDTRADNYTYRITVTNVINSGSSIHNTKKGQTNFTATGLDPGDRYMLSVVSVTPENTLSTPEEVTNTTNPSPVTGLKAVDRTTNSLTIEWIQPTDTRADNYTYRITVTNVINSGSSIHNTKKGQTNFTATGLDPGDRYMLSVVSVTPENTLSTPEEVTNTTNPSPVTGLKAVDRTTNSLTIEWIQPTDTRAVNYTYRITVTNVINSSSSIHNTKKGQTNFTATGLDPGDRYTLSVVSVTPEDTLSTPEKVSNTTNPSPVTGLKAVDRTTNSLTIEWIQPTDTRAVNYTYRITVTNVINSSSSIHNTKKGQTNFTATGLDPGDRYTLSVVSVTPEDTLSTPEKVSNTTNPSPVTGLKAVDRTTNSLTIEWIQPTDTRAVNYTYRITVTNVINSSSSIHNTKKGQTNFTATGLDPGDRYTLSVVSVTPEDTLSTPEKVSNTTNPSPVTGLKAVDRTTNSLTIEWIQPTDTRAVNYTYRITVTNVINSSSSIHNTKKGQTNFTATGLDPGDRYTLSVVSVTPEDTLSTPEKVSNTTNPSPVTGLKVVDRTTNSLTIEWIQPTDTRADNYTYRITVTNVINGISSIHNTTKGQTNFTVEDLDPGYEYTLSVQSVSPEDTLSSPVNVTSTTNPSPVTGLKAVDRTTNSLTIEWIQPTDTRADNYTYRITVTNVINRSSSIHNTTKGQTNFIATGLDPGDQYTLSVVSVTPENTLSTPEEVTNTTNPSPVTGLKAVDRTTNSLTIEWIQPTDTRAVNYTYRITVTNVINSSSSIHNTKKGQTNFTATGLDPGDQYTLSVVSVTPENTLSSPVNVTSTTNPSSATELSVVNRTMDSVALKWRAPTDSRAFSYTYKITATTVNSRSNNIDPKSGLGKVLTTDPGSTEFIVMELIPGAEYKLTVESETPENTLSAPLMVTSTTIPDTISKFRCAGSTGYMIRVEWNEPEGMFTDFTAIASDGDRLVDNRTIEKGEKTLSIPNLQPGRKYTIKITTVSRQTNSEPEVKECWTSSDPIIIGATVGSLLGLIVICVLLFFIFYRARRHRKKQDPGSSSMGVLFSEYKPIPLSEYERYFQKKHADTDIGFAEEYQSLANVGLEQSKEVSQLSDNRSKNRYTNIFPYDATRVKLSPQPGSSSSDYINASYMPGYNVEKAFIAAQGPLPHTVADFWRMIWEQKSKVIVMLTNCVELNRVKCECYWPMDNRTSVYGDIAVNIISEEILPEWTIRNLHIEKAGCSQPRTVTQMHFTSWPDHGVPNTTDKLLQFQKFVRDYMNRNQGGLPVVHCSAGVGRTGTFIGLDYLMQCVEKELLVDVYGIVRKMRMNRTCMVQTESQYIFLHQCVLDMLQQMDVSEPIYENQTDLIYENASAIKAAYNHNH